MFNNILVKVDEIAERILTLGHTPFHSFSDYNAVSDIKEAKKISDGKEAMNNVHFHLSRTLIQLQRDIAE
jgi:starvation-inducible DNA-binding protein